MELAGLRGRLRGHQRGALVPSHFKNGGRLGGVGGGGGVGLWAAWALGGFGVWAGF